MDEGARNTWACCVAGSVLGNQGHGCGVSLIAGLSIRVLCKIFIWQ